MKDKFILPKYVRILYPDGQLGTSLILEDDNTYYRPAGVWSVTFKVDSNKIIITGIADKKWMKHLHDLELVETTKEFFMKDNEGYVNN